MDNGYATLRCTLKVHPRCDACKRHTMEIITSIVGAYDVTLDSERRTATIVGQVDPNFCMRAISRCNGHAEVVRANLSHPNMMRYRGYQDEYDYDYDYGSSSYDYNCGVLGSRRRPPSLPGMYHEYPRTTTRGMLPDHQYYWNYHGGSGSGFNYDSLSTTPYNSYYSTAQDQSMSYCSIQ